MIENLRVLPRLTSGDLVELNPRSMEELGIHTGVRVLRFGVLVKEVRVQASLAVEPKGISLPQGIIDHLGIPLSGHYSLTSEAYDLILGPYIGILATRTQESLDETVHVLTNYVYDYDSIGGAVLAFAREGIDLQTQQINGYLYDPETKEWRKGNHPLPAVIFRRVGIPCSLREYFISRIGNKVFNSYNFDKWEMHQWLSQFPQINQHLPETVLYTKPRDIHCFLTKHPRVYLKPVGGSQGLGILQVSREGETLIVRYRESQANKESFFSQVSEANGFFRSAIGRRQYLVQEGLPLMRKDQSMVDFRLVLVKNQAGNWEDLGVVARYGSAESIVSNVSAQGRALMGEVALKDLLGLADSQVSACRAQMTNLAVQSAQVLESCGLHLGNLGFDFGIDTQGRLWILEINNRDPNHTILIDAKNRPLFYQAKRLNMLYAKYLAGFPSPL